MRTTNPTPDPFPATRVFKWLMIACTIEFLGAAAFLPTCYHRNESIRWPVTTGMISRVELKDWIHKPHTDPSFKPVIFYDYTVDGVAHRGERVSFDDGDGVRILPREKAAAWIDRNYPVGKRLPVYYDPGDPNLAVLEPGAEGLVMICHYVMATLAICFLLAFIRYRIARRRDAKTSGGPEAI
jgi:Protein of unknown function (DUF3592)